jgi:hypothetical protein
MCAAALADATAGCGGTSRTTSSQESPSNTTGESSATGATTNVDTLRTAQSIEQALLAKRGIHAKVVCPAVVPAVPGATFECIANYLATQPPHAVTRAPFLVTIQNAGGSVTFEGK